MDRADSIRTIYASLERLRRAQRRRRNAQAQASRSGVQLPPLALSILAEVHHHGPVRVKDLAERAEAELPRVSREIRNLESDGYVSVCADPSDKRARIVELTEYGRDQWRAYRTAGHVMLKEVLSTWDDEDVLAFAEYLRRFLERPH